MNTQTEHTPGEAVTSRVSQRRLAELLDIAAEVFFEHGFAAASVGEMARRARASKGTFYNRFPSKSDLFAAIIERRSSLALGKMRELFESDQAIHQILQQFADQLFELTLSRESIALVRLLYMEAQNFPELGRSFHEHGIETIQHVLIGYLRRQSRAGTIRMEHAPIVAEQFVDGLIGGLIRRLALGVGPMPNRQELDLRASVAIRGFLAAYSL